MNIKKNNNINFTISLFQKRDKQKLGYTKIDFQKIFIFLLLYSEDSTFLTE